MNFISILSALLLASFLIVSYKAGILYNTLFLFLAVSVLIHLAMIIYTLIKGQYGGAYWLQNFFQLGHGYWIKLLIVGCFYLCIGMYNTTMLPAHQFSQGMYLGFKYFVIISCLIGVVYAVVPTKSIHWPLLIVMGGFSVFMTKELLYYQKTTFDNAVTLSNPFKATAIAGQAGNSALFNHHYKVLNQRYAVDFVLPGVTFDADGMPPKSLNDYPCFGAPMFAPIDGKIVAVENNLPDVAIGEHDTNNPVGNYVTIAQNDSTFVLLAHMKQHSVRVSVGQTVYQGKTVLGECGNSGNTTEPHLHIQAQNHSDYKQATFTYPLYFEQNEQKRFVRSNDQIN
jgi:hypothetical protein